MTIKDIIATIRDWTKTVYQPKGDYVTGDDLKGFSLISETGYALRVSMDPITYEVTIALDDKNGNELSSKQLDLPLETMVVDADYDPDLDALVITLNNGTTLPPIPVSSIVSGLVPETRKVAGVDLKDDITDTELISALGIDGKVEKEKDKGLSSNDFTDAYKDLLDDLDSITEANLNELLSKTGSDEEGGV